ncbi:MAG: flagellin [Fibrobacteria bacterium]|nr:flagellin [Fibrobacteria bacterium]
MRINHNIAAMITQNSGRTQQGNLQKSLEKLSTGMRINRASDDAAGLSVSEQLRTQIRGLKQAQSNASDGIGLLQIAEGAANEISSLLQRMRELAVQSANDTLTSTERSYTNTEFQALMTEISRIGQATQYNGMTLLDGASGSFGVSGGSASVIHVGANNNSGQASGTVDTLSISVDALTLGALGITLQAAGGTTTTNITNQSNSFNAITSIDGAIKSINNMRADMGAYINRLDHAINNIANQTFNTQDAEARIRDVDFATETTQFTKSQILAQSSTAMLSQANLIPQSVLQLLG